MDKGGNAIDDGMLSLHPILAVGLMIWPNVLRELTYLKHASLRLHQKLTHDECVEGLSKRQNA